MSNLTYAAVGLGAAATLYALTPGKFERTKYMAAPPEQIAQYPKGSKVYDANPNGSSDIKFSKEGLASTTFPTFVKTFQDCVEYNGDRIALRYEENCHTPNVGPWKGYTWRQYYASAEAFAKSLLSLGFAQHKAVSICAFNAPEWHMAHCGVILAGGKSAGIYSTNTPDACQYIADHSESEVVVVDSMKNAQKFLEVKAKIPTVKRLVVFQDVIPAEAQAKEKGWLLSWSDFLALGKDISAEQLRKRQDQIQPNHCCSLIYTSGTTGNPKAVMITHDNMAYSGEATLQSIGFKVGYDEHVVSYLPLSHIAAQAIDIGFPILNSSKPGQNICCHFARPDVLKGSLGITLKAARPTLFMGVPRVWEKFVEGIKEKAKSGPPITGLKKKLVDWCKNVGLRGAIASQVDGDGVMPRGYSIAKKVLFGKVREALGLDRCRYCVTGAAPITRDTLMFLGSLGINLLEVYGMSECTGSTTVSSLTCWRWGSCGWPMKGVEVSIFHEKGRDKEGEGEICYRGRHIMLGYMKGEEKTREAIDPDGWLHSGDVGRFDNYGLLHITGRIKELIIGAGGENIAPVPIEDEIKRLCPALSNVIMIGDKRKYNVCLVTVKTKPDLSPGAAPGTFTDELANEALAVNPAVRTQALAVKDKAWNDYVFKGIKAYNDGPVCVSNAQKIQKFKFLPCDLTIAGGELTPTMKIKRNVLAEKYAKVIDEMYTD